MSIDASAGRDAAGAAVRRARLLLWVTLGWNVVEGIIAVASGIAAGSIALVGFGLDSGIEVGAAAIVLWRFSIPHHEAERAEAAEGRALRVIGVTFLLLAAYVTAEAAYLLVAVGEAGESLVGIGLAAASVLGMPVLARLKWRAADEIGSAALRAEAKETLACSFLSAALFVGLVANAIFGWWWADPLAALVMVPWIAKEGLEGLRGERCEDDTCD